MAPRAPDTGTHARYERLCVRLARIDAFIGGGRSSRTGSRSGRAERDRIQKSAKTLGLAGISLEPRVLLRAGRGAFVLCSSCSAAAAIAVLLAFGPEYFIVLAFAAIVIPLMAREATLSYPASVANKRAESIMKGAPEAANLMIMSLRHEPSLSKAIRFASDRGSEFSHELKQCVWDVVMGKHASFEDSLLAVGARWEEHDADLKASLHAMVTASCEATEDGKRRALDRANNAIISGAKRRIEAYALSLSAPSMAIFGLGILLPLMIGSFLPMMSWSIWSPGELAAGGGTGGDGNILETMFLMNILFPCIAFLLAMGAVARHPLEAPPARCPISSAATTACLASLASVLSAVGSYYLLDGSPRMSALLLSLTMPIALALIFMGSRTRQSPSARNPARGLEDALFKTGARMLEGENFEGALHKASMDVDGEASSLLQRLSFRSAVAGQGFDEACREESRAQSDSNALEGLRVVREAASKDEPTAGTLAMDLAAYLKDLHDLEATLKNRLRPTISMMKLTAFALGPVVMGVTFAIYLMLMSMAPGSASGLGAESFFVVLGVFLAETNGVVSYFVWGIEGRREVGKLVRGIGACMIASELVYIATATVAS